METVITISGKAQHGKDTIAKIIKTELEKRDKRVVIIGFGDYLKFIASKYYGYKGDEFKHEPEQRHLLQYIGTEVVRSRNPYFWRNIVQLFLETFSSEFDVAIIPDARFPDELGIVCGGCRTINLKIVRSNFDNGLGELSKHTSETSLDNFKFEHCIEAETVEELESNAKEFINNVILNSDQLKFSNI